MQNIIAIENGVTRHPLYRMKEPVNMTLAAGEHIAVVGKKTGAGKKYIGRYDYRSVAVVDERSEI